MPFSKKNPKDWISQNQLLGLSTIYEPCRLISSSFSLWYSFLILSLKFFFGTLYDKWYLDSFFPLSSFIGSSMSSLFLTIPNCTRRCLSLPFGNPFDTRSSLRLVSIGLLRIPRAEFKIFSPWDFLFWKGCE